MPCHPETPIIRSWESPACQCPPPHQCHTPAALATTVQSQLTFAGWLFPRNQSTAPQRLQKCVLSPPQDHLCPFLCTSPFPCWKHEQGKDRSVLILLGQKQPGI